MAQTLLEFAFLAALSLPGTTPHKTVLAVTALVARIGCGLLSVQALAALGSRVRREVQVSLWRATLAPTGVELARANTAAHHRVLTQAPTDCALGIVVPFAQLVADVAVMVMLTIALLVWNPMAGAVALAAGATLIGLAAATIVRGSGQASVEEAVALDAAHRLSWDVANGTRDIVINAAQPMVSRRSDAVSEQLDRATRKFLFWFGLQRAGLEMVALALVAGLALGRLDPGTGLLASVAVLRLIPVVSRIGGAATQVKNAHSRLAVWLPTLEQAVVIGRRPAGTATDPDDVRGRSDDLSLVHLDVQPGTADDARLRGPARLTVSPGSWVRLDGPSGVGKTSVLDAIAGLWRNYTGTVQVRRDLRLAYATQSPFLFSGTLTENVTLGRDLDPQLVEAAVQATGIPGSFGHDYRSYPIDDRGTNISAGQRQRISIARALAAQPDLILLDEATANLDLTAESEVLDHMRTHFPSSGVILVAHRPPTVAWPIDTVSL
ncbi:MAG: ABC transporter ATP-binding protein [Kineosporiaceae bacterium]|nr:ABC transporter ATP-binding protein [Kineosporiaceae bacterium]